MRSRFQLYLLKTIGMSLYAIQFAHAQPAAQIPASPNGSQLPSSEEILKSVKQNLCAPTIDPKKKLEATACVDCAKESVAESTGLGETADKVRSLFAPLKAEENKAQIRRDLAFFNSKYGKEIASYSSVFTTEQQLSNSKAMLKSYVEAKEKYPGAVEKLKSKISAFENAAYGKDLSEVEKAIIKEQLDPEIQSHQSYINSINQTIDSVKKISESSSAQAELYKPTLDTYETMLKTTVQQSELKKKAIDGSKDEAVLALYSAMLSLQKQQLSFLGSISKYEDAIAQHEKKVSALEKKLAAENLAKEKPEAALMTEERELAKAEEKVLSALNTVVMNIDFKACGMTVAEAAMLRHYTGSGYKSLNDTLRSGGEDAAEAKIAVEVLNSALRKLNRYKGPVKRTTTLPQEKLEEYQVGKIISFPAYTSTSLSIGWHGNAKFVIHSKTGRYVGVHSNVPGEDEVLIAPGAKFKVIDRKEKNGNVEFILDEIDPKIRPKAKN